MARTDPQFNLRVPSELKQLVEDAAKDSGRSINAEAVYRLTQSFEQKSFESLESVPTEDLMKELAKRLDGFSVVAK
ncbi:Arc family DNA-binding protein [Acinetobacter sp. ANC 4635]|uniref:Arc family DNA-binding protein n=1 Tax=Acinetobacter sp. ANC 4635 TaxID=2529846 RepID=UPI00103A18DB|nr:Arc family DNA-binding protein [Acinetobacter sp. ANC 4635]TCB31945.1 Arc family DNA-binding protein [Acinetobacter sp. ANC 4635]